MQEKPRNASAIRSAMRFEKKRNLCDDGQRDWRDPRPGRHPSLRDFSHSGYLRCIQSGIVAVGVHIMTSMPLVSHILRTSM